MPYIQLTTTEGRPLLSIHAHDFREAVEIAINRGLCLDGLDARAQNLRNANLDGWHIRNADFRNADLHGANLSECRFEDSLFMHTNLRHACLCYSDVVGCNLEYANLLGADLAEATLENCRISAETLEDVKIRTLHRFTGNRITSAPTPRASVLRQFNHPKVEYIYSNTDSIPP